MLQRLAKFKLKYLSVLGNKGNYIYQETQEMQHIIFCMKKNENSHKEIVTWYELDLKWRMHCAEVRQQDIYVNETPQFRINEMWVKPEEVLLANALWYVLLYLCIVLDEHLRLKCSKM